MFTELKKKSDIFIKIIAFFVVSLCSLAIMTSCFKSDKQIVNEAIKILENCDSCEVETIIEKDVELYGDAEGVITGFANNFIGGVNIAKNVMVDSVNNILDFFGLSQIAPPSDISKIQEYKKYQSKFNIDSRYFQDKINNVVDCLFIGDIGVTFTKLTYSFKIWDSNVEAQKIGSEWTAFKQDDEIKYDAENPVKQALFYLKNSDDLKKLGEENNLISYSGSVNGIALVYPMCDVLLNDNGSVYKEWLKQCSNDEIEKICDIGSIEFFIWVDKKTNNPVKLTVDLSDAITKFNENFLLFVLRKDIISTDDNIRLHPNKIITTKIEINFLNFNQSIDFEIPEEAIKAAKSID